jgi:hypothetical protein
LRVGSKAEAFRAEELADDAKIAVLRAYLRRWTFAVGVFFDGRVPDSTDEDCVRSPPDTRRSPSCGRRDAPARSIRLILSPAPTMLR